MKQYSIATNWDNHLIEKISELNDKYTDKKIHSVFGAFQTAIIGHGRLPENIPSVSIKNAKEHINLVHEKGLEFNYLINSPCIKENDNKWISEVIEFINSLNELKIDSLTISNIFLINLVKTYFPDLKINVSLIAGVDSIDKAKIYENLGVDLITLNPHTINRDFQKIEEIIENINCKLQLYANISCLNNCPYRDKHYKLLGKASQTNIKIKNPFYFKCSEHFINNPIEFIKSTFIRPEDINFYNNLGINHFKLSDRSSTTEHLVKVAKAYLDETYNGNLFELIFRNGAKINYAIKDHGFNEGKILSLYIDNKKLNNFIEELSRIPINQREEFYKKTFEKAIHIL
jgi:collagenase-like PrtC family protease